MKITALPDTLAGQLDAEVCRLYVEICKKIKEATDQALDQIEIKLKSGYKPSQQAIARLLPKLVILEHPWRVQVIEKTGENYLVLSRLCE